MYARVDDDLYSDSDLIYLAKRGDQSAMTALLARHSEGLARYCRHLMQHDSDAEDVYQESMMRALTRIHALNSDEAFRGWLFRIARNLSVDWYRRRQRVQPLFDGEGESIASSGITPQEQLETSEEHQMVAEALNTLKESHRNVLILREVEGMSYADIAHTLNVSQSAVETLLFRARRRLKEQYNKAAYLGVVITSRLRTLLTGPVAPHGTTFSGLSGMGLAAAAATVACLSVHRTWIGGATSVHRPTATVFSAGPNLPHGTRWRSPGQHTAGSSRGVTAVAGPPFQVIAHAFGGRTATHSWSRHGISRTGATGRRTAQRDVGSGSLAAKEPPRRRIVAGTHGSIRGDRRAAGAQSRDGSSARNSAQFRSPSTTRAGAASAHVQPRRFAGPHDVRTGRPSIATPVHSSKGAGYHRLQALATTRSHGGITSDEGHGAAGTRRQNASNTGRSLGLQLGQVRAANNEHHGSRRQDSGGSGASGSTRGQGSITKTASSRPNSAGATASRQRIPPGPHAANALGLTGSSPARGAGPQVGGTSRTNGTGTPHPPAAVPTASQPAQSPAVTRAPVAHVATGGQTGRPTPSVAPTSAPTASHASSSTQGPSASSSPRAASSNGAAATPNPTPVTGGKRR